MKTKQSFEEKKLLPSFIIEEDCLDSENIPNGVNNSNSQMIKSSKIICIHFLSLIFQIQIISFPN